ncbi:hypothetical protein IMSAG049_01401 [Clostridiales bacterium]|nr:hypothetical protein IMSAG049_01401 [Clostridiales bacterium]
MEELSYKYYCEGWGCGQSIIKAADEKYSLGLSGELLKSASAAGNGFGYGGLCAAVAASILLFGALFDENTAKSMRILFLDEFSKKYGSLNCCAIACGCGCGDIVKEAARIVESLIGPRLIG